MITTDIHAVRDWALGQFKLGRSSIHGFEHWDRVHRHGLTLAERTADADTIIVQLFAVLHDCRRRSEGYDPSHGPRAAAAATEIRNVLIHISDDRFNLLLAACRDHTDGHTTDNPTIGCCWDADLLDLTRVGIRPKRRYFSTEAARSMVRH